MISMTRYSIKNESLTPWVKFIWCYEEENANIHNKLLPTDSIDVLLNLADEMIYEVNGSKIVAPPIHINGLRSSYSFIHQVGHIRVFGISFHSYGLYPFVHKSVKCTRDKIIRLDNLSLSLTNKLQSAISFSNTNEVVCNIERALDSEFISDPDYMIKANLISDFINVDNDMTVQEFCAERHMNIKTFERFILRYTGYTPKALRRIKRFQMVSNQLIHEQINLLDLTYHNSYADQSHFIKEFRLFSGKAPRVFQKEKISVKENATYSYI